MSITAAEERNSPEDLRWREEQFKKLRRGDLFYIYRRRGGKDKKMFFICILKFDTKKRVWCYPIKPHELLKNVSNNNKTLHTKTLDFGNMWGLHIP